MRKLETLLTGFLGLAAALLLPMAALEPWVGARSVTAGLAAHACDDGSAHLAMGCASVAL